MKQLSNGDLLCNKLFILNHATRIVSTNIYKNERIGEKKTILQNVKYIHIHTPSRYLRQVVRFKSTFVKYHNGIQMGAHLHTINSSATITSGSLTVR